MSPVWRTQTETEVCMVDKLDLRGGMEKMREVAQLLTDWAEDMERSRSIWMSVKKRSMRL